ncbi:hypothetical protein [uncultured Alistipes sp.]|jgi:hypothetical protein|uniref:hypothetical protein n=1 Tax=uncultured Alistipes sp. TaxID=538949 RepID=UPI0025E98E48|nr:hypothetical protein [uncultured Alistipes sp.]
MKHTLILFAATLCCLSAAAQAPQQTTAYQPANSVADVPSYFYCEIIGNHLPTYKGKGVLFDFGQGTDAWRYNQLRDADGNKLLFESTIAALNYMLSRGWEFVQSYTSGQDNELVHHLLRISSASLTTEEQQSLIASPPTSADVQDKPKKKKH